AARLSAEPLAAAARAMLRPRKRQAAVDSRPVGVIASHWPSSRCRRLVHADGGAAGQLAEGPHAADTVPGVLLVRLLALALVAFQEAGDKQLLGQRVQSHAASATVADELKMIVRVDSFYRGPRLRSLVGNLVSGLASDRLAASQPHQRVAVGGRHVYPSVEELFHA